jgi:hypothetical protein
MSRPEVQPLINVSRKRESRSTVRRGTDRTHLLPPPSPWGTPRGVHVFPISRNFIGTTRATPTSYSAHSTFSRRDSRSRPVSSGWDRCLVRRWSSSESSKYLHPRCPSGSVSSLIKTPRPKGSAESQELPAANVVVPSSRAETRETVASWNAFKVEKKQKKRERERERERESRM